MNRSRFTLAYWATLIGVVLIGMSFLSVTHVIFWGAGGVQVEPKVPKYIDYEIPLHESWKQTPKWEEVKEQRDYGIQVYKRSDAWNQRKWMHRFRFAGWLLTLGLQISATFLLIHPLRRLRRTLLDLGFSIQLLFLLPLPIAGLWAIVFEFEGVHGFAVYGFAVLIGFGLSLFLTIARRNLLIRIHQPVTATRLKSGDEESPKM